MINVWPRHISTARERRTRMLALVMLIQEDRHSANEDVRTHLLNQSEQ